MEETFKKPILRVLVSILLILGVFLGQTAIAEINIPSKPTESIYVQDYANVLSVDSRVTINKISTKLNHLTKAQIVVVTIDSLEGAALEDYSLAVLKGWGIGDSSLNNGVLLLISIQDRKSRIEVGYGLEGTLNDAKTGKIQDEYLIPFLKEGRYDEGLLTTYKVLATTVAQEYKVDLDIEAITVPIDASATTSSSEDLDDWWIWLLAIIVFFIIDWFFLKRFFLKILVYILGCLFSMFSNNSDDSDGGSGGYGGGSGGGGGSSRDW